MAMRPRSGRPNHSHPPRLVVSRVYEQFKPMSEWRQEDDHDTLLVYLPGFQKEYIKVTTEDENTVRVRGERLIAENKWSRFQEDFRVPENCDMRGIRARFDGGILTVTMPRKISATTTTTTTAPRVAPKPKEQPFRRQKQEEALPKPKEEPKEKATATTTTAPRVAPKPKEQPFRRQKQEEALPKPKEEPKEKATALESEKKPDRPRSPLRPRSGRPNHSHPPRLAVSRVYEQFKPMSEWRQEDDHDTLLVYLPGFQKEYIKVTTEDENTVRVRGERLIAENKWSRFQEDFRVPENCDMRGIRARFDGGILTVTMPRKITATTTTTTTAPRVAPKPKEQPFRRQKQEEALPKPKEEPKEKATATTTAPRVSPKPKEQPFRRQKQEEALPKPKEEPKEKATATTTTAPRVAPKPKEQPFRRQKQEEALPKSKEEPKEKTIATTTTAPRVAPKPKEQPFRRQKQEEALPKPKEEPKEKVTALESEKKPDRPRSPLRGITLPPPPPMPPVSSSKPPKQEPLEKVPETREKNEELMFGSLPTGLSEKEKHGVVEKPINGDGNIHEKGVVGKTDLDEGKLKEKSLEEEMKRLSEGRMGKSKDAGVNHGGFLGDKMVEMKKVVARREVNEDRKLLMNVGVGVLVIVALGVHVSYAIGLIGRAK